MCGNTASTKMRVLPRRKGKFIACAALALCVITFGYYCPCYWTLGIPCPGCFMTRALFAVLHLDFAKAYNLNATIFIMPICAVLLITFYKKKKICKIVLFSLGIIMMLYWVYRIVFLFGDGYFVFNNSSVLGVLMNNFGKLN